MTEEIRFSCRSLCSHERDKIQLVWHCTDHISALTLKELVLERVVALPIEGPRWMSPCCAPGIGRCRPCRVRRNGVTSQNSKFWNVILNKYLWLFVWMWCDWLCEIEWEFETFWKLNEREWNDFPKLLLCILISMNSNSFQMQNPRVKITWLLPFKMRRVFWKYLNFICK